MLSAAGMPLTSDSSLKSRCSGLSVTAANNTSDINRSLICFGSTFEQIRKDSTLAVSSEKLISSAITAMVAGLDPYSTYMDAYQFRDLQIEGRGRGEQGATGVEVAMVNGLVKVVAAIEETPAAKAGIRSGDIITHVDGEPLRGLSLEEAIRKMRGPVNSRISYTIVRKNLLEPINVAMLRDMVRVNSVRASLVDDVGILRIAKFDEHATESLRKAIADLQSQIPPSRLKGYVIDLRNNPGGLLDQAISVASLFMEGGEIASTRGRGPGESKRFSAKGGDLTRGKPLTVLINGGSAAASEIVTGALQDHKRATIVGTRSFGLGTVQSIIPLGAGKGALKLTTARHFTPSGRSIQAKGIDPDIEVLQEQPEEFRSELKSKTSLRRNEKASGQEQTSSSYSYVPSDPKDDKALRMAVDLLRGIQRRAAFPPKTPTTRSLPEAGSASVR
ncbi:S41 family peptidase [Bradyrhizobium elkanii]|uniref:S41 family peptidase n=1 Tax=Bradyrhizobium elkanii TaxID=29448 RepID=UPI003F7362AD